MSKFFQCAFELILWQMCGKTKITRKLSVHCIFIQLTNKTQLLAFWLKLCMLLLNWFNYHNNLQQFLWLHRLDKPRFSVMRAVFHNYNYKMMSHSNEILKSTFFLHWWMQDRSVQVCALSQDTLKKHQNLDSLVSKVAGKHLIFYLGK